MLSFAETDLVHRDHAIPGLAMVLDPDTFATALRRAAPDADLRTAQITYRRYKPQNFCRVAYRLDVAGAELDLDVRACRPEDLASWLGERDSLRVTGPLGQGRIVFEDRAIVVNVFPNDLKLPQLHHLADPRKREHRSEEHTSELQSPYDLVCRLLLEKKKTKKTRLQHIR